jgi:hypothetical protein
MSYRRSVMGFDTKRGKRSPLKEPLLRQAGQSLNDDIDDIIWDKVVNVVYFSLILILFAGFEWWRSYKDTPPFPIPITLIALLVSGFAIYRVFIVRKHIKNIRLGINGEKTVAQFLEVNRDNEWRLLNDIPVKEINSVCFNLDHVLVTPKGIFVIETKTIRKPAAGGGKIAFDGKSISINGGRPNDRPIVQVRAACEWMREFLKRETGKIYDIKGVVVIPGWFVEGVNNWKFSDVWVLNHKALPGFIKNSRFNVSNEDMHLAVARIADHMQRTEV